MNTNDSMRKIPYGMSNYGLIRRENYYYVDKTPVLKLLEDTGRYQFFIRPRRFGKSPADCHNNSHSFCPGLSGLDTKFEF
ncbi:MAG: AAA family ATPase [Acidobacteria bacterium]|nr:AAA family ATPase [Acidobacteriota bacterium]